LGKIFFNNNGVSPEIKNRPKLRQFLFSIFKQEFVNFNSVLFIFCKDDYLHSLNQKYLNHDTYTDILTFTLSEENEPIHSEIYISVERVNDNSHAFGVDNQMELLRVMIHGILHLCGYSDHTLQEKKSMRQKEDFYLSLYCST
jgi:probable rRNA maturation factor